MMHRLAILSASRVATRAAVRQHVAVARVALPSSTVSFRRTFVTSTPCFQAEVLEDDKATSITAEYNSLQPFVHPSTYRALVGQPFNFTKMSEVQQRVLSLLPALADPFFKEPMPDGKGGRDLLVKAKTGTGKTIAFLTPAIERRIRAIDDAERGNFTETWEAILKRRKPDLKFDELDEVGRQRVRRQFSLNTAGTLIISPTRELATQIADEAKKLCQWHGGSLNVHLFVGGTSRDQQMRHFNRCTPDIIVATPGRLLDFLREESVVREPMTALQTLIYDEADTLLDMGFRDDIEEILTYLPKPTQRSTMLFSATVSKEIREVARKSLLPDHRFIDCVPAGEENVHEHVPQSCTVVADGKEQLAHLTRLIALDQLRNAGKSKVIVFLPTKQTTKLFADLFGIGSVLSQALPVGRGLNKYELHSQLDSSKRFRVSGNFRNDKSGASILFTSDVSARGVDYPGTTQVIQVGIPSSTDIYIHRVGRTGRAGKEGRADLIIMPFEQQFVRNELKHLNVVNTSTQEVKGQVEELAKEFDKDPKAFVDPEVWKAMQLSKHDRNAPKTKYPTWDRRMTQAKRRSTETRLTPFTGDVHPRLVEMEKNVSEVANEVKEEDVEQSFMSLLGYYAGRAAALRTSLRDVVEDLKEWAVSVADMERPPYVSDQFLAKIGGGKERGDRKRGGGSFRSRRFDNDDRRGNGRRFDDYDRRGSSSRRSPPEDRFF